LIRRRFRWLIGWFVGKAIGGFRLDLR
jgi:hypothetical protein